MSIYYTVPSWVFFLWPSQRPEDNEDGCGFPLERRPLCPKSLHFLQAPSLPRTSGSWTPAPSKRRLCIEYPSWGRYVHTAMVEPTLTSSTTIWSAAATVDDQGRLQRTICSAETVIGCNWTSFHDLFAFGSVWRARKIVANTSQPGHKLFESIPSGRRLRSMRTNISPPKENVSSPSADGLNNKPQNPHWIRHLNSPDNKYSYTVTLCTTLQLYNIFHLIWLLVCRLLLQIDLPVFSMLNDVF